MRHVQLGVARAGRSLGRASRRWAVASLAVLLSGAVLFGAAWAVGGEDAVSDNWVGVTVALALLVGLIGSLAAFVAAVFAGVRHEPWARLWLPLAALPSVVVILALLETFVLE